MYFVRLYVFVKERSRGSKGCSYIPVYLDSPTDESVRTYDDMYSLSRSGISKKRYPHTLH
jgi:hypothetical protein